MEPHILGQGNLLPQRFHKLRARDAHAQPLGSQDAESLWVVMWPLGQLSIS